MPTPTIAADALLEQAFDAAGAGLALIDPTGRTVRVNPALAALLGRDEADIRANGLQQVLGEHGATSTGSQLVLTRTDGSVVHVRVSLTPLTDAEGQVAGVLAELVDIGRPVSEVADLRRMFAVQQALADDGDVAQTVCEVAREITGARCAVVYERDGDEWLRSTATAGLDDLGFALRADQPSGVAHVLATGRPLHVQDAPNDPGLAQVLVARAGVGSLLYQPVLRDATPVAVLALGWAEPQRELPERIAAATEVLAAGLALGLRRAEHLAALEAATTIDPQTGLLNARGWDGALFLQLERSRRTGEAASIALLEPAPTVASPEQIGAWRQALRVTDALARIDETRFAVLLADCALAEAQTVIERMEPSGVRGIVQWDGLASAGRLMAQADAELYTALVRARSASLHDPARLAAVEAARRVGYRPVVQELAQAAATAVDAQSVAVALVGDVDQTFAGQHGLDGWDEAGTPLAYSFSQYPAVTGRPLVVEDAREHPLVRDNPAIAQLDVVAYAGIPLRDEAGHVLGALCAVEPHPRAWAQSDIGELTRFAELAAAELRPDARRSG